MPTAAREFTSRFQDDSCETQLSKMGQTQEGGQHLAPPDPNSSRWRHRLDSTHFARRFDFPAITTTVARTALETIATKDQSDSPVLQCWIPETNAASAPIDPPTTPVAAKTGWDGPAGTPDGWWCPVEGLRGLNVFISQSCRVNRVQSQRGSGV